MYLLQYPDGTFEEVPGYCGWIPYKGNIWYKNYKGYEVVLVSWLSEDSCTAFLEELTEEG